MRLYFSLGTINLSASISFSLGYIIPETNLVCQKRSHLFLKIIVATIVSVIMFSHGEGITSEQVT